MAAHLQPTRAMIARGPGLFVSTLLCVALVACADPPGATPGSKVAPDMTQPALMAMPDAGMPDAAVATPDADVEMPTLPWLPTSRRC